MFVLPDVVAQNSVCFQVKSKDFGIWAYKQHNEICRIIFDNMKSGKLAGYNARNSKETRSESLAKLATYEVIAFVQTDPDNPTIGHDTTYMEIKQDNYYLFKTSEDNILVKSDKKSNNVLKLKKAELMALLSSEQRQYFNDYTSNFALNIDSIPSVSKRFFLDYISKLFEYAKQPSVKLFTNDSLNRTWTFNEKTNMAKEQTVVFIATDPDDPTIGIDSIILTDYNIRDTAWEQTILFMIELKDFRIRIKAVSCGLEKKIMEYMPVTMPFGYLPYTLNMPFSSQEMEILNAVFYLEMEDDLNTHRDNEDIYDDYFEALH